MSGNTFIEDASMSRRDQGDYIVRGTGASVESDRLHLSSYPRRVATSIDRSTFQQTQPPAAFTAPFPPKSEIQYVEVEKPRIVEKIIPKEIVEEVYVNVPVVREVVQPVYVEVPDEKYVEVYNILPPPCPVIPEKYRKIIAEGNTKLVLFLMENDRLNRRLAELRKVKRIQTEELLRKGIVYDPSKKYKKREQEIKIPPLPILITTQQPGQQQTTTTTTTTTTKTIEQTILRDSFNKSPKSPSPGQTSPKIVPRSPTSQSTVMNKNYLSILDGKVIQNPQPQIPSSPKNIQNQNQQSTVVRYITLTGEVVTPPPPPQQVQYQNTLTVPQPPVQTQILQGQPLQQVQVQQSPRYQLVPVEEIEYRKEIRVVPDPQERVSSLTRLGKNYRTIVPDTNDPVVRNRSKGPASRAIKQINTPQKVSSLEPYEVNVPVVVTKMVPVPIVEQQVQVVQAVQQPQNQVVYVQPPVNVQERVPIHCASIHPLIYNPSTYKPKPSVISTLTEIDKLYPTLPQGAMTDIIKVQTKRTEVTQVNSETKNQTPPQTAQALDIAKQISSVASVVSEQTKTISESKPAQQVQPPRPITPPKPIILPPPLPLVVSPPQQPQAPPQPSQNNQTLINTTTTTTTTTNNTNQNRPQAPQPPPPPQQPLPQPVQPPPQQPKLLPPPPQQQQTPQGPSYMQITETTTTTTTTNNKNNANNPNNYRPQDSATANFGLASDMHNTNASQLSPGFPNANGSGSSPRSLKTPSLGASAFLQGQGDFQSARQSMFNQSMTPSEEDDMARRILQKVKDDEEAMALLILQQIKDEKEARHIADNLVWNKLTRPSYDDARSVDNKLDVTRRTISSMGGASDITVPR